jgi:hypothetical protein
MAFHAGSVSEYEYRKSKGRSQVAGSSGLILPASALGFGGGEGGRGGRRTAIRVKGGSSSVSKGEVERRRRRARACAWVGRRHGRSLRGRNIGAVVRSERRKPSDERGSQRMCLSQVGLGYD